MRPPADFVVAVIDPSALTDDPKAVERLAVAVGERCLRLGLDKPGFAVADLGPHLTPVGLRRLLLAVAASLDAQTRRLTGRRLPLRSIDRFDQQATTLPHRDGGPEESVVLLGYEPSEVASRLYLSDYTQAAVDAGLTPAGFLARFNPMRFRADDGLGTYTAEAMPFPAAHNRLVAVNNSARAPGAGLLGVLHKATVERPLPGRSRVINSLLLGADDPAEPPRLSEAALAAYVAHGTPAAG